jgi:hypothetical protein
MVPYVRNYGFDADLEPSIRNYNQYYPIFNFFHIFTNSARFGLELFLPIRP